MNADNNKKQDAVDGDDAYDCNGGDGHGCDGDHDDDHDVDRDSTLKLSMQTWCGEIEIATSDEYGDRADGEGDSR